MAATTAATSAPMASAGIVTTAARIRSGGQTSRPSRVTRPISMIRSPPPVTSRSSSPASIATSCGVLLVGGVTGLRLPQPGRLRLRRGAESCHQSVELGQCDLELGARADAELHEDLAQVVLGGAGADEQPRPDVAIGEPLPRETGDVELLVGELVDRLGRAGAHGFAGGGQFACGSLGKAVHAAL